MAVSEAQLDTWSAQGSVQQSAATYKTIDEVLNDKRSPIYQRFFDTFLQGSYGNDTNIYADSDVDIAIRLTSVFYTDTSALDATEKANYERNRSPSEYSLAKFKDEVTHWLKSNFGNGVKAGKKAIFVPSNGYRRDADVLACAEHREYWSYPSVGSPRYREGIIFWTTDGVEIVNYPKQHSANCTTKHQETGNRYKRVVRVVKNIRNRMVEESRIEEGVAPSYFLEGLLWNVPNAFFTATYKQTITDCINYIAMSDTSKFHCANGIHYLLRNGHPVCWSPDNFNRFMGALKEYWA
ncbi:UNVERIFIED_ORG: hypothetical protein GGI66_006544 [Rhizobium esperanzae]